MDAQAQAALIEQVLIIVAGASGSGATAGDPATMAEATRSLLVHLNNPLFLEALAAVFAGRTGSTLPAHVLTMRQVAGATLKGALPTLMRVADDGVQARVRALVFSALPEPTLALVSSSLVAGLCLALQARMPGGQELQLTVQWPDLAQALQGALSAPPASASLWALHAVSNLAADGMLRGSPPGEASPAAYFLSLLPPWVSCRELSLSRAASGAGCAILVSAPAAMEASACLGSYLGALEVMKRNSVTAQDSSSCDCIFFGTCTALVRGAAQLIWPHLAPYLDFAVSTLGPGAGGGERAHAAGSLLTAALSVSAELDLAAGCVCTADASYRRLLLERLPLILRNLVKGMEFEEGGTEEEEEEDFRSVDTVRLVCVRVLKAAIRAFPEHFVPIFQEVLGTCLQESFATGDSGGGGGGGGGGSGGGSSGAAPSWVLMEASIASYTAVCDVLEAGEGTLAPISSKLLPLVLRFLNEPTTAPSLRSSSARFILGHAQWLSEAQRAEKSAAPDLLLAGTECPLGQSLAALCSCLTSPSPTLVRCAGTAIAALCSTDGGFGALPYISNTLFAVLRALESNMPCAPPSAPSVPALPPDAAADLRCTLWIVLKDLMAAIAAPLEAQEDLAECRRNAGLVLTQSMARFSATDPHFSSPEAAVFLNAAALIVHPAGEGGLPVLESLVRAGLALEERSMAEYFSWLPVEAAQVLREAAVLSSVPAARPGFDFSTCINAMELISNALQVLVEVEGSELGARGLPKSSACQRAGVAGQQAASTALLALAPALLASDGALSAVLSGRLPSSHLCLSAYGVVGEMANCRVLWPQMQTFAPSIIAHCEGMLRVKLAAMVGAGAAQSPADAGGGSASATAGATAGATAPSPFMPDIFALGNLVWAVSQVVTMLQPEGAREVAQAIAPAVFAMLRIKDIEDTANVPGQQLVDGVTDFMCSNGVSLLLRLCALGAVDTVREAGSLSQLSAGWLHCLADSANFLEVLAVRVDAAVGLCAIFGVISPEGVEALPIFACMVECILHDAFMPAHLKALVSHVFAAYKGHMGGQWGDFCWGLSEETRQGLAITFPGIFV